jgi:hypothetical protein
MEPATPSAVTIPTRPAIHVPVAQTENERSPIQWQDVQEVWFPGDHSDVGGGHRETALADVSLHWMINEAHAAELRVSISSYSTILPELERLSPADMHDEMTRDLRRRVRWWLLEYWPRRDIENEPPPPRLSMLRPKRLGPRVLGLTARQGVATIHRSARHCYTEASAPWRGTPCKFIETTERVLNASVDT